ncbi:MAG: hypothetical protein ACI9QC_000908 [Oceanicoccus sp.]|jgi:hypothetical protein
MRKLLALTLITLAFASCGGPETDESSDLLDGILDSQVDSNGEVIEDYEVPTSEGPTSLPTEDNE